MKVLQLCLKPPVPAVDGGCKAMNNITQGLLNLGVNVKILTLSTHKHPFQKEKLNKNYIKNTAIESVFIDTQIKIKDAFLNLFSSNSYNIERFYNRDFEKLIIKTLKENNFDVVLFESLYVTPYTEIVKKNSKAKLVYRSHNIEYEIWKRNATLEKGAKKQYLNLLAKRLKKYEKNILNKFDGIAAITEKDKQELKKIGAEKVEVFPFGINTKDYTPMKSQNQNLFYIGSMDWAPNINGVKWFLDMVWPKLIKKQPELKFYLAGRKMPKWLLNYKQQGINVIGEVESANDFINQNQIMIVPLFAGSGMRIKIIEAMALGKMVIATSIALEGIKCKHQKNVIVANNQKEFSDAILYYTSNINEQEKIAKAGLDLVQSNYDNQVIVNNLVEFFNQI